MKKSFLAVSLLWLLLAIPLISTAFSDQGERYHITTDLCQLQAITELASNYGISYRLEKDFDAPAIRLIGDSTVFQKIEQEYEKYYPKDTVSSTYARQKPSQQCHLHNARYNAENVNPRLAPLIPNDADYVSYAPKANKAIYCYYHLSNDEQKSEKSIGSQCYFLQIKNEYGTEWLIKDDISELENANLEWAKENYQSIKNQQTFNNVYTYVYSWNDNPGLMYGFKLSTNFNGTRWLAGGTY